MTDIEKLRCLLREFGVGFNDLQFKFNEVASSVECLAREHAKVEGYSGFAVNFNFDIDGKFIGVGIWE